MDKFAKFSFEISTPVLRYISWPHRPTYTLTKRLGNGKLFLMKTERGTRLFPRRSAPGTPRGKRGAV